MSQDCSYIPASELFITFAPLHALGCKETAGGWSTNRDFTQAEESHLLYGFSVLNVDFMPMVNRINEFYVGQSYWKEGWGGRYGATAGYAATNVCREGMKPQFDVSSGRVFCYTDEETQFCAGIIKQRLSSHYDMCLITEESEKSYYTLETRLFTYPLRNSTYCYTLPPDNNSLGGLYKMVGQHQTGTPPIYTDWDPWQLISVNGYGDYTSEWFWSETNYRYSNPEQYNITMSFFLEGRDKNAQSQIYKENEACNIRDLNLHISSTGINRYCYLTSDTPWSASGANSYRPARYIGSLVSDCNAYASSLAYMKGNNTTGRIVQVPEQNVNGYGINTQIHGSTVRRSRSKQVQLRHIPYKLGVDARIRPTWTDLLDTILCDEGYLSSRDVILASVCNQEHKNGLFNNANMNIKELEFELFYCANINDPTPTMNLVTFGRKINKIRSGFDTHIPATNHTFAAMNSTDTVKIRTNQFNNVSESRAIYGSSVVIDDFTYTDVSPQYSGSNNLHISVTPSVTFTNIYVWNNNGINFNSKITLTGSQISAGQFTYGEYLVGIYDKRTYLIPKSTYNAYMYNPGDFIQLAYDICSNDNNDPFKYACNGSYNYDSQNRKFGVATTRTVNALMHLDIPVN